MMKLNLMKLTRWSDSRPLVRSIYDNNKNNGEKYQREE